MGQHKGRKSISDDIKSKLTFVYNSFGIKPPNLWALRKKINFFSDIWCLFCFSFFKFFFSFRK